MITATLYHHFTGRHKTPRVIQMEATECGAASLGIVMSYYGCYRTLEELREKCGVSRNGVNAFNMVKAAESYGFIGEGYEVPFEDLDKLELPAILHWDENHFVVLEGMGRRWVHINDPATGPRRISIEEFKEHYSDIALLVKPGPDFKKQGEKPSLLRSIRKRISPFRDVLFLMLFLQIALVLFGLVNPAAYQIFLDKIVKESVFSWKWEFLGLLSGIMLLIGSLTWIQGKILNRLHVLIAIRYSAEFLWHVLHLPTQFFTQRFGGEIIQRMNLNNRVASVLTGQVVITFINILFIGVYGLIIYQYDVLIAMIGIGTALFNMIILIIINRMRTNAYARMKQEQARAIGVSLDAIQNIETIKSTTNDHDFFARISGLYTKIINTTQSIGAKDVWLSNLSGLAQQLSSVLLLTVGVWRVMYGSLTVGMLIGLQILLNYFTKPFGQLVSFGTTVQSLHVDIDRLDDVLENSPDPLLTDRAEEETEPPETISFEQVNFGYAPLDNPVVEGISFQLNQGEWLGIVGKVGSGKSTIVKLATGLYAPWSGSILYDGKPLQFYSRETIKKSLAYVDQQIVLFGGSIRDNLTLWDRSIPEEDIEEAARDAEILDVILGRGDGFHAELIENGRNFSEGQRQRLEIARALVLKPKILILDEATSALDFETEKRIMENLRKRNISCLIVAHRRNTIEYCDRLLVVDEGKIVKTAKPGDIL